MKYIGPDFYDISSQLTEEELFVQKTANEFVTNEFKPVVNEHYHAGTFPMELIPKLGELGFLGSTLPEESGGAGVSSVAYGLIMHELERGDSGLRSFASVQGALVMYPIHAYGSDEQKSHWLSKLGTGEAVGCFGLTEPNFGSNPGGMVTKASRDGDDWILNGAKMWITNGAIADVALVWAKDDEDVIRGFLIEKGTEGFTAPEQHGKLSLRASVTSELVMENVHLPDSARLPGIEGLKGPLSCLTQARYGIAWGVIGAAVDCYETAVEYSTQRKQFSRQDEQCRHRARNRSHGARHPWRQRHPQRVFHHAPHGQPRERLYLRGDARDAHTHPRAEDYRPRGVRVIIHSQPWETA